MQIRICIHIFYYITVIQIRYLSRDRNIQTQECHINLAKNEERFYFGLCPVSLKTSSVQDPSCNQLNELKVTEIDWQLFDCKCCNIIPVPVKDYMSIWLEKWAKTIQDRILLITSFKPMFTLTLGLFWLFVGLLYGQGRSKTRLEAS